MSRIVAQLILSIVAIIAAPIIYFIIIVIFIETNIGGRTVAWPMTTVLTLAACAAIWILLWIRMVHWSIARVIKTVCVTIVVTVCAAVGGGIVGGLSNESELGWVIAAMVWALGWYAATPLVWRETAAERAKRHNILGANAIPCPVCGYNLTGLYEALCPECGGKFTLDQLLTAASETKQSLPD